MNRKKKINSILIKRMKKANSKLNPGNKPRYISKEERAKSESGELQSSED
jgi:hypothetical protein